MLTTRITAQTDTDALRHHLYSLVEGLRQAIHSTLCQRCQDPLDSTEYPPLCHACYHLEHSN